MGRVDIKAILRDPVLRRKLLVRALRATQAREGRELSWSRAYEVYDKIQGRREEGDGSR